MPEQKRRYESIATLAVVNYQSIWGDKSANLQKMIKTSTTTAQQGNDIIAFPELALSGCESNQQGNNYKKCAETIPGPATDELADLAKKLQVYIIFGMPLTVMAVVVAVVIAIVVAIMVAIVIAIVILT